MSIAQQQAWTVRLLETVRQMKYGSIFNEDGKHIIFTPSQVADCMKRRSLRFPHKMTLISFNNYAVLFGLIPKHFIFGYTIFQNQFMGLMS